MPSSATNVVCHCAAAAHAAASGVVVFVVRALVLVGVVQLWVRRMVVVDDSVLVHHRLPPLPFPVALVLDDTRMMSAPSSSLGIGNAGVVFVAAVAAADVGAPNNNSDGTGMAAKDGATIPAAAVDMSFGSNTEKNQYTMVGVMMILN